MDKRKLAEQLRNRQYDIGMVDSHVIATLTDTEIIAAYTSCHHCGAQWITGERLAKVIAEATSADDFLELSGSYDKRGEGPWPA